MSELLGLDIMWGMVDDPPKLPDGWTYRMAKGEWVIAVSPEGAEYFVSPKFLYPRRMWSSGENKGKFYIDTRGTGRIELGLDIMYE
jgi:hypothetical protein